MSANGDGPLVIGIDLGGTKILAGVVGSGNVILGRAKRATPAQDGGEAILKAIVEAADEAMAGAGVRRDDVAAAAVGSPGPLDPETGVILFSANLSVRNFPLGPLLSAALGKPVLVRNDVRVGGYGEYHLGAGRGFTNMFAAFVGTGIGGCLVMDGSVVTGSTGNAGEVGHVIVKAGGPKCGCGREGCLEALSSRTAIIRRIGKGIKKGIPSSLSEKFSKRGSRIKSGDLAEAYAAGDHLATREVRRAAHFLGLALGGVANLIGPEVVVIGGGVTGALGEPWVDLVRVSFREQALCDPAGTIRVERAALGDDAGMLGAALMAREHFLGAGPGPGAVAPASHLPSGGA